MQIYCKICWLFHSYSNPTISSDYSNPFRIDKFHQSCPTLEIIRQQALWWSDRERSFSPSKTRKRLISCVVHRTYGGLEQTTKCPWSVEGLDLGQQSAHVCVWPQTTRPLKRQWVNTPWLHGVNIDTEPPPDCIEQHTFYMEKTLWSCTNFWWYVWLTIWIMHGELPNSFAGL